MATEPALDREFQRLNEKTLYPSALTEENAIRIYKTHRLYQRLSRIRA